MSDDKDDMRSIKVYKFDNTKESWHEFALKFRVMMTAGEMKTSLMGLRPTDGKEIIEILPKDDDKVLKAKKDKLAARVANKKGYRDLVMSTEVISLNIVENATSDKLSKRDLRKAWGRLEGM